MSDSQIHIVRAAGSFDGLLRRLLAALVDGMGLAILLATFLGIAGISAAGLTGVDPARYAGDLSKAAALMAGNMVILGFATTVLVLLYKVGFEASALRATPGKVALGLRVAAASGDRLSVGAATIRAWPWWVPPLLMAADDLLGAGLLFSGAAGLAALVSCAMAVFVTQNTAIHDMMVGALVAGKDARFGSTAAVA